MVRMKLRDLYSGCPFKLKRNGRFYVRGNFNSASKLFSYYDYYDVSKEHFAKGHKEVIALDDDDILKL